MDFMDWEDVQIWLRELLKDGPVDVREIRKQAKEKGLRMSFVQQARYAIGAKVQGISYHKESRPCKWLWYLPETTGGQKCE